MHPAAASIKTTIDRVTIGGRICWAGAMRIETLMVRDGLLSIGGEAHTMKKVLSDGDHRATMATAIPAIIVGTMRVLWRTRLDVMGWVEGRWVRGVAMIRLRERGTAWGADGETESGIETVRGIAIVIAGTIGIGRGGTS